MSGILSTSCSTCTHTGLPTHVSHAHDTWCLKHPCCVHGLGIPFTVAVQHLYGDNGDRKSDSHQNVEAVSSDIFNILILYRILEVIIILYPDWWRSRSVYTCKIDRAFWLLHTAWHSDGGGCAVWEVFSVVWRVQERISVDYRKKFQSCVQENFSISSWRHSLWDYWAHFILNIMGRIVVQCSLVRFQMWLYSMKTVSVWTLCVWKSIVLVCRASTRSHSPLRLR